MPRVPDPPVPGDPGVPEGLSVLAALGPDLAVLQGERPSPWGWAGDRIRCAPMPRDNASPGRRLLAHWKRLERLPGGKRLFSYMVGRGAPYTGTIGAQVVALEPGYVRARLADRRKVRNHLQSVHAVALTNLGEVASGLATLTALPPDVRGIVTRLSTEYKKKARGILHAECRSVVPEVSGPIENEVEAVVRDQAGDEVGRVRATWLLTPREG